MLAEIVAVEGAVPLAGLTLSHPALLVPFQLSVPPPVFEIDNVWFAGFDPPSVAVKVKLDGLTPIVGGGGAPAVEL